MSPSTTKSIFLAQPTLVELAWNDPVLENKHYASTSRRARAMHCHVAGWTGNSDDRVTGPSGQPRLRDREHVEPKAFNVLHNASAFVAKRPDIRKAKEGWGFGLSAAAAASSW